MFVFGEQDGLLFAQISPDSDSSLSGRRAAEKRKNESFFFSLARSHTHHINKGCVCLLTCERIKLTQ